MIFKTLKPLVKLAEKNIRVIICEDGSIFMDKIWEKINRKKFVFLAIPLRLGIDKITSEYLECLNLVFTFPQNVGIIGG
jgi:hypothetical protein